MTKDNQSFETKLIHAGEPKPRIDGAINVPIFQSSTYEYAGEGSYHDVRYLRLSNTPNHLALHKKLAALEGAEAALVTSSGMSAITTALLTFLKAGDHLLAHNTLYGGTANFVNNELPRYGIERDLIDATNPSDWESKLKPNTKVIYVETITNPIMDIPELGKIVEFAKTHELISMIDNTFASPVLYCPVVQGFDLSLHSCTKYINGHSDIVAGAVIGSADYLDQVTKKLNHLGGSLDSNACFLLHRGVKTLALRMNKQCENAMLIAPFLENHPQLKKVNYPGLESNSSFERAKEHLCGFGAMLSFEIDGDVDQADQFINHLQYAIKAPSLGGVETLVTRPVTTSHALMDKAERKVAGISDTLIRYSVGIEAADDLIADLQQALEHIG
ncbi:MAG TPA: aminotransferase class I/II-fold pyridoxal phosphate-dependent enzyme [Candidatus Marinimicrobia bacterium]|jgi:cystathionine beta-lyase/cystathionine gamma-synthase|nr:aminotransferase class I/II-fold pyridoxal phosphate-dependent enzyme [Candidatus Neomarinimicrobiota bacterium]